MAIWAKDCKDAISYSYEAPAWNKGLDKYYRDFCAGKVGQEIKVSIKLVDGREYDRPMRHAAGTIRNIQRKLGFDV